MAEIEIDMSPEHERAKDRVIMFTNLALVHKLESERITNSPDGGVEINYITREGDGLRLARVDMAKDGLVYVVLWNRSAIARMSLERTGHPVGAVYSFSEEMMPALIHRIQHFLASGRDR